MSACLEAVEARLRDSGCQYEVLEHQPVPTTQEAAGADRVSGYAFAKAVMLIADGQPQLHVLRAADTVDLESARAVQGARDVRLARESEFMHLFPGCEGAPPPIPLTRDHLAVRVDRRLQDSERITFEVGDGRHSVRMRISDYLRLVPHQVADFAETPAGGRRRPQSRPFEWGAWAGRGALAAGGVFTLLMGRRLMGQLLPNRTSRSLAIGAAAGAVAAALADPQSGARRRHLLWDRTGALVRRLTARSQQKGRYWGGRVQGIRHNVRRVMPEG